ncbi:MAG TPA: hypothetical protein VGF16_00205 [Bryobacteraceae bacterium]
MSTGRPNASPALCHNGFVVGELLASAHAAALHSKPDVRAAALLRIARVQTAVDRSQARRTFEQALDEIRRISGRDGAFLLEHARLFAAAVAPDMLPSIPAEHRMPRHFEADLLGRTMIEHGNLEAALEFVMRYDDASTYPFPTAGMLIDRVDAQERLALVRRAAAAWREAHGDGFILVFQYRWKLLPDEEARAIVREIVRFALDEPDKPTRATYERTIQITSSREHRLFQVLPILRQVDQPLLESLLSSHPQFAAAARRFPYGMESIMEEARGRMKSNPPSRGGFGMLGNPRDFPYFSALMQGSQDGDFEQAMEHAQQQYRIDAGPEGRNMAPAEFWPSASQFRSILYSAGKRLGAGASRYLARIEDPDLRLFAQIELAAGLAGLPEFPGIQRGLRSRRPMPTPAEGPPVLGASGETIRCPKCNWVPRLRDRWRCKCGHSWNTFETAGACPACRYQWDVTACLSCGETSAHSGWYVRR